MDYDHQTLHQTKVSSPDLLPHNIEVSPNYITVFYVFVLENLNGNRLTEGDWVRTISLSIKGIGPELKNSLHPKKHLLVDSGRQFTFKFLDSKEK